MRATPKIGIDAARGGVTWPILILLLCHRMKRKGSTSFRDNLSEPCISVLVLCFWKDMLNNEMTNARLITYRRIFILYLRIRYRLQTILFTKVCQCGVTQGFASAGSSLPVCLKVMSLQTGPDGTERIKHKSYARF
jgi:hypothetical protein